jgi:ABC-type multidrug transport system ATPase subunit
MALSLPLGQEENFPVLFDEFDEKKDHLGLQTYSLSMSTLEEVFLRLAEHENNAGAEVPSAATSASPALSGSNLPEDLNEAGDQNRDNQDDKCITPPLPSVAVPVNGGGGGGVGGGDVWAELDDFECKKSTIRQVLAVLVGIFAAARRNPITFFLLVWNPVWMCTIVSLVFPLVKARPPTPVSMVPALLDNTSLLVAIQPLSGMAGPVSDRVIAQSLSILGHEFKDRTVRFQDAAALNLAMLSSTAGNSSASISVLFEVDPLNGSGSVTFGYNKVTMKSARVLVAQALNATAYLARPNTFPTGIGFSYLLWRSPLYSNAISAGGLSLLVCTAFNVLAILYAMDMVRLRVARVKEMFLLSGLPRLTFWIAHGLGHLLLYCIAFGIAFIILRTVGGMDGVVSNNFLGYVLLYLFFAPAIILLGYCLSFLFEKEETAQVMTDQIVNLTVFIPWIIMVFVSESKKQDAELCLSLIPGWALYRGHSVLETAALNETPFSAADVFNWDKELAQCLMMLSIDIVYLSVLLWLLDTGLLKKLFARSVGSSAGSVKDEAKLLEEEESLAKRLPPIKIDTTGKEQSVAVVANNLVKTYRPRNAPPTWACRGVSLQVEKGTVYGLLGPNGAGKSTMMSMLTGIEACDSGDGFINGKSIMWDLETCRSFIGLCPQFDALIDYLTAREHLVMLAEIRGVPSHLVQRVVERAIVDMALSEKAGAVCKTYSGGNKRKLSVAMSIVANPKVSFLDEPSTGMDPETRRHMWAFISRIAQSRAVILTTHSMEEADALCNRIGIMIHGNLRAEGTSQELKSHYGSGFLIQVRFDDKVDLETSSLALTALLRQLSPGLKLEDSSTRAFRYEVPQSDVNIGPLFKAMIENKAGLGIEDFSVSQSTLEDVFLFFARQQSEEI